MKFTVREVGPNSVTVDFEDGSWAEVPYSDSLKSKADLIRLIDTYAPKLYTLPSAFVTAGEELDSSVISEEDTAEDEVNLLNYAQMRERAYPSRGDQLDALYWARKGDSSHLEEIDKSIAEVKALIPKTIKEMSVEAFSLFLLNA